MLRVDFAELQYGQNRRYVAVQYAAEAASWVLLVDKSGHSIFFKRSLHTPFGHIFVEELKCAQCTPQIPSIFGISVCPKQCRDRQPLRQSGGPGGRQILKFRVFVPYSPAAVILLILHEPVAVVQRTIKPCLIETLAPRQPAGQCILCGLQSVDVPPAVIAPEKVDTFVTERPFEAGRFFGDVVEVEVGISLSLFRVRNRI